jgi:hypothetical protein
MHVCIQDFGERKHERSSLISSRRSLIQNAAAGRADGAQASCAGMSHKSTRWKYICGRDKRQDLLSFQYRKQVLKNAELRTLKKKIQEIYCMLRLRKQVGSLE